VINGDTLAVVAGGTTPDAISLAGNYTGASFAAPTVGNTIVVTNMAGAPARDDLSMNLISVSNSIGLSGSFVAAFENEVSLAVANWGSISPALCRFGCL
jgi:hypothetical protein